MANIWKSLKGTTDKVLKKASKITKEAADKAGEVTKLGKIKLEIYQIKKDIEKKETELGHLIYKTVKESQDKKSVKIDKNMEKIVKEIDGSLKIVKEKEEEYNKLRSENDNIKEENKSVD